MTNRKFIIYNAIKITSIAIFICVCLFLIFTSITVDGIFGDRITHNPVRKFLKCSLNKSTCHFSSGSVAEGTFQIVYVMGGKQEAVEQRFGLAAEFYRSNIVKRVVTLSSEGITEYSQKLRRNLTNNEWTMKLLTQHGIKATDIELVSFKSYYFGTLSEINGLKELCKKTNRHNIIIVSSDYHTARIEATAKSLNLAEVTQYRICGCPDRISLFWLFKEFIKLIAYREIILPNFVDIDSKPV